MYSSMFCTTILMLVYYHYYFVNNLILKKYVCHHSGFNKVPNEKNNVLWRHQTSKHYCLHLSRFCASICQSSSGRETATSFLTQSSHRIRGLPSVLTRHFSLRSNIVLRISTISSAYARILIDVPSSFTPSSGEIFIILITFSRTKLKIIGDHLAVILYSPELLSIGSPQYSIFSQLAYGSFQSLFHQHILGFRLVYQLRQVFHIRNYWAVLVYNQIFLQGILH
ncbi:hypothetical protein AGLY_017787 [Aphis glycines]|uniref:Uncharacterized protein n=1 Tax=Aphis glycines TaxID=307491 RepID=A0A6G0STW3_APHGL|nr:hypothetical protein AGLY_017787 [Aphis glycines]